MEVKEFRFLNLTDIYDKQFEAWSRIYEYPYVLRTLEQLGSTPSSLIHNTSWGFTGCHITFKDLLDAKYPGVVHSDIRVSTLPNTMYYDVTQSINADFKEMFDFILNISTLHELHLNCVQIIKNLMEQLHVGGHLIVTFDVSDDNNNITVLEDFIGTKIDNSNEVQHIRGDSSQMPNDRWTHLRCGVLVIQKTAA